MTWAPGSAALIAGVGELDQLPVLGRVGLGDEVLEVRLVPDLPGADRPLRQAGVFGPEGAARPVAQNRLPDEPLPAGALRAVCGPAGTAGCRSGLSSGDRPGRSAGEEGQHVDAARRRRRATIASVPDQSNGPPGPGCTEPQEIGMRTLSTPPRLEALELFRGSGVACGTTPQKLPGTAPRRRAAEVAPSAAIASAAAQARSRPRRAHRLHRASGLARPRARRSRRTAAAGGAGGSSRRRPRSRRARRSRSGSAPAARSRRRSARRPAPGRVARPCADPAELSLEPLPGLPCAGAAAVALPAAPPDFDDEPSAEDPPGSPEPSPSRSRAPPFASEELAPGARGRWATLPPGCRGRSVGVLDATRVGLSENRKASQCQQSKH